MAAEVILGLDAFTEQAERHGYVRGSGWRKYRTWIGPQHLASQMEQSILDKLDPDDIDTQLGVPCTITASFPDVGGMNETVGTRAVRDLKWVLDWQDSQKDIHSHGKFNLSGIAVSTMQLIDRELSHGRGAETDWGDGFNMNTYVKCRVKGNNTYMAHQPIVRAVIATSSAPSAVQTSPKQGQLNITAAEIRLRTATEATLKAHKLPIDIGATVGQFVTWLQIRVGTNTANKNAKFPQPTIHYCDANSSGAWVDKKIDLWYVKPPKVSCSPSSKRWEISYEWLGMMTASKILYDLSAAQIAAGLGEDP